MYFGKSDLAHLPAVFVRAVEPFAATGMVKNEIKIKKSIPRMFVKLCKASKIEV
jgi:hypothetical protein